MVNQRLRNYLPDNRHHNNRVCNRRCTILKNNKLKIEVFVPFGVCVCSYAPFIEKVGNITTKFKKNVDVKIKSTLSNEAKQYAIQDSCIVIDEEIKLPADFNEKQLEETIVQRITNRQ